MAAGMDFSPPITILEGTQGNYSKDNASVVKDENSGNSNKLKQMAIGKPPRNLSLMRHSVSSNRLLAQAELVSFSSLLFASDFHASLAHSVWFLLSLFYLHFGFLLPTILSVICFAIRFIKVRLIIMFLFNCFWDFIFYFYVVQYFTIICHSILGNAGYLICLFSPFLFFSSLLIRGLLGASHLLTRRRSFYPFIGQEVAPK